MNHPPPSPAASQPALSASAVVALLIGSAMLAFGPMLVRMADTGPITTAFWRMGLASPVLLMVALAIRRRNPAPLPWRQLPLGLALLAGALFAGDLATWHLGIVRTTSANATLFGNTTAFMLAGWAILVQGQRPDQRTLWLLALAVAGALLLFGASARISPQNLAGDLLSLVAAAFYTGYLLVIMRMRGRYTTATVLALATIFCALLLLPLTLLEPGPMLPERWWPLVALAISSQLAGQGLMVFASGRLPATIVGLGLLVQPLVSAAAGWLAFGEMLGPVQLLGAGLLLIAIMRIRR